MREIGRKQTPIGVILAAGMAKRLRPLTDERPKCLLTIGQRTLLQRTVDGILDAGISELVVVTGYRGQMIREFLTQHYPQLTIHFLDNADYAHTNNIFSLWLTRPYTDGRDFLLLDSDILFDPRIIPEVLKAEGSALALNRHELGEEEMKIVVDDNNNIVEISKTCAVEKAIGESVGIEKMTADYSRALFKELEQMIDKEGLIDIFYERAFERLIPQGHTFRVVDTTGFYSMELDTVEDFENAKKLIRRRMNFLDRNEFNFEPSQKVIEAIKNFDPKDLCFYTRIYDQGKKSVISVRVSEIYGVPEEQVLLTYGGEDMLKNAIHYFLMKSDNKKILIPEFSWWYYNKVVQECDGMFEMYPLHEQKDAFAYDIDEVIAYTNRIHPCMLLLASPNNPTGNSLDSEEIVRIMENIPSDTMVLVDEAYANFITSDVDYIAPLVNKYNNLIISRTLSKFYGLPGLRCGFGFIGKGHDQFLSYINKYLGYNRFSEAVALAALESDDYYRHVADDMEWGRQLYKKELGNLPGFKVYKSMANFILIKYPVEIRDALMEALRIQDYKIKFMSDKGLESCLRITLGRKEQTQVVCDTIKRVYNNK